VYTIAVIITQERPDSRDATSLIDEIVRDVASAYPPTSRHDLGPAQLATEGVAFFITRVDDVAPGCGGIKLCGHDFGEIKRLYVRPSFRRRGDWPGW
jgi:putative acetyltransferase